MGGQDEKHFDTLDWKNAFLNMLIKFRTHKYSLNIKYKFCLFCFNKTDGRAGKFPNQGN